MIYSKKEKAIIIDRNDNIQQHEYVYAIVEVTWKHNICVSRGKCCRFLTSVYFVEHVVNTPKIKMNELPIKIKVYCHPDKRIILSNVCPTI